MKFVFALFEGETLDGRLCALAKGIAEKNVAFQILANIVEGTVGEWSTGMTVNCTAVCVNLDLE